MSTAAISNSAVAIRELTADDALWPRLWPVIERLEQKRNVKIQADHFHSSHVLAALLDGEPVGFMRIVVQRLGEDEERPPVVFRGQTLYEAKSIAFGVLPEKQRQGIGRALQEAAMRWAQELGCYQIRSRSDYGCTGNYHLKMSMGFGIQPSLVNDSVYFVQTLAAESEKATHR